MAHGAAPAAPAPRHPPADADGVPRGVRRPLRDRCAVICPTEQAFWAHRVCSVRFANMIHNQTINSFAGWLMLREVHIVFHLEVCFCDLFRR